MVLLGLIGLTVVVLLSYLVLLVSRLVELQLDEQTRAKHAIYETQDQTIRAMFAAARRGGDVIDGRGL